VKPFGKNGGSDQCHGSEGRQNGQHGQIPACMSGPLQQFLVNRIGDGLGERGGDWWYWGRRVHIGDLPNFDYRRSYNEVCCQRS
jgi:hypothetical protein